MQFLSLNFSAFKGRTLFLIADSERATLKILEKFKNRQIPHPCKFLIIGVMFFRFKWFHWYFYILHVDYGILIACYLFISNFVIIIYSSLHSILLLYRMFFRFKWLNRYFYNWDSCVLLCLTSVTVTLIQYLGEKNKNVFNYYLVLRYCLLI